MIVGLDHIGIAVSDMEAAVERFRQVLGIGPAHRERSDREMVEEAILPVGDGSIQLLAPTSPSSSVARFLDRRGPALHHVGLRVDDLSATLVAAEAGAATVLQPRVRTGSRRSRIAFLDPRGLAGVLVEMVQPDAVRGSR